MKEIDLCNSIQYSLCTVHDQNYGFWINGWIIEIFQVFRLILLMSENCADLQQGRPKLFD
jgi:hypothetical protein